MDKDGRNIFFQIYFVSKSVNLVEMSWYQPELIWHQLLLALPNLFYHVQLRFHYYVIVQYQILSFTESEYLTLSTNLKNLFDFM